MQQQYNPNVFDNSAGWANIPNKVVGWKGYYEQAGQKQEMSFRNLQVQIGGGIVGSGSDAVGSFDLQGTVSPNGDVAFTKQYHGKHAVQYRGRIQGGLIKGKWSLQGMEGDFELAMDSAEVWSGWYEQGGNKADMKFNLSIDQSGVFGAGDDKVGNFIIRGQQEGENVMFSKAYHGAHTVNYYGQLAREGNGRVIRGYWNASGANGGFELRSQVVG